VLFVRRLERDRADTQAKLDALRGTHAELMKNLENFSMHVPLSFAGEGAAERSYGHSRSSWESDALARLKEYLTERGSSPEECFKKWNEKGTGQLTEREFVAGVVETSIGLQEDKARRLFRHVLQQPQQNPAEPVILLVDFEKMVNEAPLSSSSDGADVPSLQAELRKLRSDNAKLLREKEEWIRKLKERGSLVQSVSQISPADAEARIQALEAEYAAELTRLEGLLAIADMNNRDLIALKTAPSMRRTQGSPGKVSAEVAQRTRIANMVIVEIQHVSLNADAFSTEPTTFLSLDFYAHDTQNTYPATGLDVELGWSCEFVVDVDEVLIAYLEKEPLRLDLMERISQSVPFRKLATASVPLKPLLDDTFIERKRIELLKDDRTRIGYVTVSIRVNQSLLPALRQIRDRHLRSSAMRMIHQSLPTFFSDVSTPFKVRISIHRAEKISAASGHIPSPYVQYSWPSNDAADEPHMTATAADTLDPVFNDSRIWEVQGETQLRQLCGQQLELVVLDDKDVSDDEAAVLGTGMLPLSTLLERETSSELRVPLQGLNNSPSGTLIVSVEWLLTKRTASESAQHVQAASASNAPISDGSKADNKKPVEGGHGAEASLPADTKANQHQDAAAKAAHSDQAAAATSASTTDNKAAAPPNSAPPGGEKDKAEDAKSKQPDSQVLLFIIIISPSCAPKHSPAARIRFGTCMFR
jgi:hypothetical protein